MYDSEKLKNIFLQPYPVPLCHCYSVIKDVASRSLLKLVGLHVSFYDEWA